jgi:hypothetical protein
MESLESTFDYLRSLVELEYHYRLAFGDHTGWVVQSSRTLFGLYRRVALDGRTSWMSCVITVAWSAGAGKTGSSFETRTFDVVPQCW